MDKLADEIRFGLAEALPGMRKTILKKLSLAVAAMIQAHTPNTMELSARLPLDTERADMREQWLRRPLTNRLISRAGVLEPCARRVLEQAAVGGQTILLPMDQTDLGDRFVVLMISVRCGDRSLPLAWRIEKGEANIGRAGQQVLLERVRGWLPEGTAVMRLADRFYPSVALFEWLIAAGWQYRLRLKGNLWVDVGCAGIGTIGELAAGVRERYEMNARLFEAGIPTAFGVLHEAGHPEPWIIAMDCPPNRAAVGDYGARWAIEPMFSDFKSRGFRLEETKLEAPKRLDCLILIMTLAMYWCVQAGQEQACGNPSATEKKPVSRPTPTVGASAKLIAVPFHGSNAASAFS